MLQIHEVAEFLGYGSEWIEDIHTRRALCLTSRQWFSVVDNFAEALLTGLREGRTELQLSGEVNQPFSRLEMEAFSLLSYVLPPGRHIFTHPTLESGITELGVGFREKPSYISHGIGCFISFYRQECLLGSSNLLDFSWRGKEAFLLALGVVINALGLGKTLKQCSCCLVPCIESLDFFHLSSLQAEGLSCAVTYFTVLLMLAAVAVSSDDDKEEFRYWTKMFKSLWRRVECLLKTGKDCLL